MSRPPSARLAIAAIGAALIASTIPAAGALAGSATPAASAAAQAAADPFRCADAATLWRFAKDFTLTVHPHLEPERGWFSWGGQRTVPDPFRSTTFAGPGGIVYNVAGPGEGHGELRRFHFNGTGWDAPEGRLHDVVATGLTAYAEGDNPRITADSTGDVYTVDGDGNLRWHAWNTGTKKVDFPGTVLEPGWGGYNLITAGGPGVLYARTADGKLHRHAFHPQSQQRLDRVVATDGWQHATRIFAAGGDVVYSVREDGALLWHRYHPETRSWAASSGSRVGTGWQQVRLAFARNDSCVLDLPRPTRPMTTSRPYGRAALFQEPDQRLGWVFAAEAATGELQHHTTRLSDITVSDAAAIPGHQSYTGSVGAAWQPDGKLRIIAQNQAGEFRTLRKEKTVASPGDSPWTASTPLGGWTHNPAAVIRSGELIHAFATSADGRLLHRRQQSANSDSFTLWQPAVTGADVALNDGAPAVVNDGEDLRIVTIGRDGVVRTGAFAGDAVRRWQALPGVTAEGSASAVIDLRGKLQIFVRDRSGAVQTLTQRADDTFDTDWRPLTGLTAAGSPAAVSDKGGTVHVFSRGADDLMYAASQKIPGSVKFGPWSSPSRGAPAATDPTAMVAHDGRLRVTFRDSDDVPFVLTPRIVDNQRAGDRNAPPAIIGWRVQKAGS